MFDVEMVGSISFQGDFRLMTEEVFDYVTGKILETLDQNTVDGVYLSMHGAGATIGHDDLEGDTLELVRKKVGPDIPIVFTLDLHSTLTEKMARNADAVSIYRTYPHTDAYEVGLEAGDGVLAVSFLEDLLRNVGMGVGFAVTTQAQRLICTCAPVRDFTGQEIARVGLFEHASDDGSILTEHNRGAWELAHLISMRLGYLPGTPAAVTA